VALKTELVRATTVTGKRAAFGRGRSLGSR
jgi:hypothetical protein